MGEGRFSISADDLYRRLGGAAVLLDGKVALSTKADSVTHFDAIEITPLP